MNQDSVMYYTKGKIQIDSGYTHPHKGDFTPTCFVTLVDTDDIYKAYQAVYYKTMVAFRYYCKEIIENDAIDIKVEELLK